MNTRGASKFEIYSDGKLLLNENNLEKLRSVFLTREIIKDELLGPGDPGDFDSGAWHILCHLSAGCAVYLKSNSMIWVEISHIPLVDLYTATVTVYTEKEEVVTFPLLSEEGQYLIKDAKLLGFVEGSSLGHISARDVFDKVGIFNNDTRQEYNMDADSTKDGGRVWEHWVVTRNIDLTSPIGTSLLKSYLAMVSLCGGVFVTAIGRGRVDYHHPEQLRALIHYGFITTEDALINIIPKPIPQKTELLLYSANPKICVKAIKDLPWDLDNIFYFMFERRIAKWNSDFHI